MENVAILTTLINKGLYDKSAQLFPEGIQRYVIDGRHELFGIDSIYLMMKRLGGKGIDWLVMADEDVLFIHPEYIRDIIKDLNESGEILCGVRDGGQIPNRTYSPYLINTFFSVVNFKKLESIWNEKEVRRNQYINDGEFSENLDDLPEEYDTNSLYEPYYRFYFWLRRKGEKIRFLHAVKPFEDDHKTTLVFDTRNREMLYHTWYARLYGVDQNHTRRIDRIFNMLNFRNIEAPNFILLTDPMFRFRRSWGKLTKRVLMKIEKLTGKKLRK
jgi:hypothetical protein